MGSGCSQDMALARPGCRDLGRSRRRGSRSRVLVPRSQADESQQVTADFEDADSAPTQTPSTRDGIEWNGRRWRHRFIKWESGAWVPSDEPPGDVVNNTTRLEKLRLIDRSFVLLLLLAAVLCLCAGWLQVIKPTSDAGDEPVGLNVDLASKISLLGAAGLIIVTVIIAAVRIAGWLASRSSVATPREEEPSRV